jgi:tetratricopeptide (TPR) repeat protein
MIAKAIQRQLEGAMRRNISTFETKFLCATAVLMACALAVCFGVGAQQTPAPQQSSNSPSQDQKSADSKSTNQKPSSPSTPAAASSNGTTYDPFHAQQDVEVGTFYMHKGDVDAAIARFEDAIRLRENFAQPRLLIAQCYEKKHRTAQALKYYREYLKVFPDAPDRKKVEKKIEELSQK